MTTRSTRRSGRRRTVNRRYAEDYFEAIDLSEENSDSKEVVRDQDTSSVSDEDFATSAGDEQVEVEEEGDADDFEEEADLAATSHESKTKIPGRQLLDDIDPQTPHSRGLLKPSHNSAKRTQFKLTFGTSYDDILPAIYAREHWGYGRDATFPSAESFQSAQTPSPYGIGSMFCFDHSKLLTESTEAWDWYYDSAIGGHLLNKQHLQVLQEDAKQRYLPRAKSRKHVIFIGPIGKQKEIHLGCNEVVDFGTAFELPKPKETKRGRPRKSAAPSENSLKFETGNPDAAGAALETVRTREGWLINFGAKIQCTAWAPNCSGTTQYLAVAVPLSKSQKAAECHVQWTGAPAFTPSPPYSTAIQIWSFEAKTTEEYPRQLNTSQKPRLRLVLCTEYGDVKRFAWCPMPRTPRAADTAQDVNLGLLAVIYGDGYLRVLDVKIQSNLTVTQWMKVEAPMFQVKPPSAVCTCLAWLSPSDIAIGCSNGFIGVWNIAKTGIESHQDPTPYIYAPVHPTYVLSISSAYPSHPHVLASSCIDGQMKLFSLRDPLVDVCEGIRMRFGTMNLEYSPYFRAFVTTDDNEFVRLQPIRRFFSTMCVLRSASNTVVTACSPCHPSVIAGTAGGQAMATNPLRRMFNSKSSHQQQTWFSHEWVHVKGDDKGERLGASRFLDGFKAESPNLMRGMQTAKLSGITIYEEETAITALACNPNEPYAGWTCAGMGSGLLRVEDLTLRPA